MLYTIYYMLYIICSKMDYVHCSTCHTPHTEYIYTGCTICSVLRLTILHVLPMQVYDTMIYIGITLCRSEIRYYLSLHVTFA